ncbi:MAG: tetratricopeptide repeat protein [Parachlamydiales bacterium]
MKKLLILLTLGIPLLAATPFGDPYRNTEERISREELAPHELWDRASGAFEEERWPHALAYMRRIAIEYPDSPFAPEALFYTGVAYYRMREFTLANRMFSKCLEQGVPKHLQEAFQYKFAIAEQHRTGCRRHMWGRSHGPMWKSGKEDALEIYDEIIVSLPSHELAALSLYSKGHLQWMMRDYEDAVETFTQLINRFPKHRYVPESYVAIARLYERQAEINPQNPDLLALAQVNVRKFRAAMPTDDRLMEAELRVELTREVLAKGLYDTGRYYERKKKPAAAAVYYQTAMRDYPDTPSAFASSERLSAIGYAS